MSTLSYGFVHGENNITADRVMRWRHKEDIKCWNAFIWYLVEYATVVDYGSNWVRVAFVSDKQISFFYGKVCEYEPEIWEANYRADIGNDLWKDHKGGTNRNLAIIKRLIQEATVGLSR